MTKDFNFGGETTADFGNTVVREVLRTDYGQGQSFGGISGHGPQDHHGGSHTQVNLYQPGVKGSGIAFRFFDNK